MIGRYPTDCFSVRTMNAHNRHLLRATFIVSALMPLALATAADLPLPPAAPAWTWSGFYIGGSVGTAAGTATFSDPYGPSIFGDKVTTAGFLAGLQLGYNRQLAPRWVVGVVADTSYFDSNGSFTCMQAFTTLIGSNCEVNPRALATVAGRVGFLVDPLGHTLVYGKGGAAWTDSHISIYPNAANFQSFTDPVYPGGPASADAGAWGGMVGVGIERALTPAWSISLEYNYYRFASTNVSTPETVNVTRSTPPAFTYVAGSTSGVTADMQVIKLALNYHLGQDPGAVWADAPVLGVAAMPVKARSVPIVDGWEVDAGARYWYSTGTSKNTSGAGSLVSQLNYSNLTGHSGELFARVDTPSQVFVKGYVGAGAITDGKQTDEDWSLLDDVASESGHGLRGDRFHSIRLAPVCRRRRRIQRVARPGLQGRTFRRLQLFPSNDECIRLHAVGDARLGVRPAFAGKSTRRHAGRYLAVTPRRCLGCHDDMGSLGDQRRCGLPAVCPVQRTRHPLAADSGCVFPGGRYRTRPANRTHLDLSYYRESQSWRRWTLLGHVEHERQPELPRRLYRCCGR